MFLLDKAVSDDLVCGCKYAVRCVKVCIVLRKMEMMGTRIAMQEMSLNTQLSFHKATGTRCEMLLCMF
jgi:hypothetical protein